jgi:hypothetical protein
MKNLERTLLILIIILGIMSVVIMLQPEPEGAQGVDHPRISAMKHGGSGLDRHVRLLWLHWGFGVLTILVLVTLVALGARSRDKLRGLGGWLLVSGAGYVAAWTWLTMTYKEYMYDSSGALFLAFPAPTAVMMYIFLPVSLIFNVLYVAGFKRWVLSDDDLAAYEELVAARQARLGDAPEAGSDR